MIVAVAGLLLATLCGTSAAGQATIDSGTGMAGPPRRPVAVRPPGRGEKAHPAKGQLLVASRQLADPNFAESVVLLTAYDDQHALGVVINRPSRVPLAAALPQVEALRHRADRLHVGGPVGRDRMLVLIRSAAPPAAAQPVFDDVYVSGNIDTLRAALGRRGRAERVRAFAGYAGWAPGQLDAEIARGDWYVTPADAAMVFDTAPLEIWPTLIKRLSGDWVRADQSGDGGLPQWLVLRWIALAMP